MSLASESAEDAWVYEYNHTESEVFLVDLDLTTVNRSIKAASANRGKRNLETSIPSKAKKQKTRREPNKTEDPASQGPSTTGTHDIPQSASNGNDATRQEAVQQELQNGSDDEETQNQSLQLLDLHTGNPIISYQGNIYSCSWADMIGTTMFFSDHKDTPLYDPEIATDEFDMIGMSRIKLVGNLAKVTPIKPISKETESRSAAIDVDSTASLGNIRSSNAKRNADLRKQANFLEQLMNIKKNRGEEDNVRVVMNSKVAKVEAAGKLYLNTQRRREEIDELNRKVVRGDAEALQKLEQIYLGQDVDESDDDVQIVQDYRIASGRLRRTVGRRVRIIDPKDDDDASDMESRPRVIGTATPSPEPQSSNRGIVPATVPDPTNNETG